MKKSRIIQLILILAVFAAGVVFLNSGNPSNEDAGAADPGAPVSP